MFVGNITYHDLVLIASLNISLSRIIVTTIVRCKFNPSPWNDFPPSLIPDGSPIVY